MGFRDEHAVSTSHDAATFLQHDFDLTRITIVGFADFAGLGARFDVRKRNEPSLGFGDDLLANDENRASEVDACTRGRLADQLGEIGAGFDLRKVREWHEP